MQLRFTRVGGTPRSGRRMIWLAILALVLVPAGRAWAADAPPALLAPEAVAAFAPAAPATGGEMSSAGWVEHVAMKLEAEAMSDVSMLPDTTDALAREWRSFDKNGSALGALINFGWVVLAGCIALLAERGVARGLSRRIRRRMRARSERLTLSRLLLLLLCDLVGVAVF